MWLAPHFMCILAPNHGEKRPRFFILVNKRVEGLEQLSTCLRPFLLHFLWQCNLAKAKPLMQLMNGL
jgi:hypothetical protein